VPNGIYDVVGVGNAIVDVIANVDDDFLVDHDLQKGSMALIDTERAKALYEDMPPGIETSGGSAANTLAGVASFGARAAFIGKVRDDQLGEVFRHDIRATGVEFHTPLAESGPPTARCLIQVTPDAQRTMNTYLGIAALLEPSDIDVDLVAAAKIVYCEGYLWDVDIAKQAIRLAMDIARDAGNKVA
jgi:sugar/nucleoside kinase (ribokinase family)